MRSKQWRVSELEAGSSERALFVSTEEVRRRLREARERFFLRDRFLRSEQASFRM